MANGSRRFGGGSNRRLARFNASGDVQWSRVSQSCSGWDRVEEMVATGDGAVLAVGGPMALRVDPSDGSVVWRRPYAAVVTGVTPNADGFALGGTSAPRATYSTAGSVGLPATVHCSGRNTTSARDSTDRRHSPPRPTVGSSSAVARMPVARPNSPRGPSGRTPRAT
ncbi:hypothetical protein [Halorientalis sp.]|uniref:hypothetical protein n=1 Tax=Halorientalis sp. TaxID=1931229 RepID=UPI00261AABA9|nr:hypothetical protein [Halorientalis sp.]